MLEELAWAKDSPIWDILKESGEVQPVPSCDEVFLPSQMEKTAGGEENAPKRYAVIKSELIAKFSL